MYDSILHGTNVFCNLISLYDNEIYVSAYSFWQFYIVIVPYYPFQVPACVRDPT